MDIFYPCTFKKKASNVVFISLAQTRSSLVWPVTPY